MPATALRQPIAENGERLFTLADVAAMPARLPSGPVRYELNNGRLVILPPSGDLHGSIGGRVVGEWYLQGEKAGHGEIREAETGLVLWRKPRDRLVGVDGLFLTKDQLPAATSDEGYILTIPKVVAEVRSKNDSMTECAGKIADYLKAGVEVVWLVDPQTQSVTVYTQDGDVAIYKGDDVLTLEGIIPGFKLKVADLFAGKSPEPKKRKRS